MNLVLKYILAAGQNKLTFSPGLSRRVFFYDHIVVVGSTSIFTWVRNFLKKSLPPVPVKIEYRGEKVVSLAFM